MEIWKPIKNYENLYEISNLGRVKSLPRTRLQRGNKGIVHEHCYPEKIMKGYYDKTTGYRGVNLYGNNTYTHCWIHRLVAEAFCENPNNYNIVDHKNGRKLDNRANNLRWVTQKENIKNAIKNGHDYAKQSTTGVYGGKKQNILCVELGKSFGTTREASVYIKVHEDLITPVITIKKNIHRACKQNKTAYKYHWKFN